MTLPNAFIIGAPKCGTTSLTAWLSEHPDIFIPRKEIHHFCEDFNTPWAPDRKGYHGIFSMASESHLIRIDASVWYLYSQTAVSNIEKTCRDARYIVCLRNPIEMAYSLHEQQLVDGNEHLANFEAAWDLSAERLQGQEISSWCKEPKFLAYQSACLLGEQMARLYELVPRDRVHLVVFDDLKNDPASEYAKLLAFLGLREFSPQGFSAYNSAKQTRLPLLRHLTYTLGRAKRRLGIQGGLGLLDLVNRLNIQYRPRARLAEQMRLRCAKHFAPDILKLSAIIQRDLSPWMTP